MEKKIYHLYEIPRESLIKAVTQQNGENGEPEKLGEFVTYHKSDGLYSVCSINGGEHHGEICHLHVMTPLTLNNQENYYEILLEEK